MIRKSILSVLAGIVFAAILSVGFVAKAECYGFCPGRIGSYYYSGCIIYWHPEGDDIVITEVVCQYAEGFNPIDPNIAE